MADQTSWISEYLAQHLLQRLHQPGVARLSMVQDIVSRTERMTRAPALQQELAQRWQSTLDIQKEDLPFVYAQPAQPNGNGLDSFSQQQAKQAKTGVKGEAPKTQKPLLVVSGAPASNAVPAIKSTEQTAKTSRDLPRAKSQSASAVQLSAKNQAESVKSNEHPTNSNPVSAETTLPPRRGSAGSLAQATPNTPSAGTPAQAMPMAPAKSTPPQSKGAVLPPKQAKVGANTPANTRAGQPMPTVQPLAAVKPTRRSAQQANNSSSASTRGKPMPTPTAAAEPISNGVVAAPPSLPVVKANPVSSKGAVSAVITPDTLPLVQASVARPKSSQPDLPRPTFSGASSPGGLAVSPQSAQPKGVLASKPRPMVPARPASPASGASSGGIIQRAPDPEAMNVELSGMDVESGNIDEIAARAVGMIEQKLELEMERRGM